MNSDMVDLILAASPPKKKSPSGWLNESRYLNGQQNYKSMKPISL
jgi:hypothetical protein